jgi:hypothetical protein
VCAMLSQLAQFYPGFKNRTLHRGAYLLTFHFLFQRRKLADWAIRTLRTPFLQVWWMFLVFQLVLYPFISYILTCMRNTFKLANTERLPMLFLATSVAPVLPMAAQKESAISFSGSRNLCKFWIGLRRDRLCRTTFFDYKVS